MIVYNFRSVYKQTDAFACVMFSGELTPRSGNQRLCSCRSVTAGGCCSSSSQRAESDWWGRCTWRWPALPRPASWLSRPTSWTDGWNWRCKGGEVGGTRGGGESTETEHIEGVDTSGSSSGRGRFRGSGFGVQGSGFRVRGFRVRGSGLWECLKPTLSSAIAPCKQTQMCVFSFHLSRPPPHWTARHRDSCNPPSFPHTAPECRVNATGMLVNNTGHSRSGQ